MRRFDRPVVTLTMIWLVATAYNLFKPYHIDDSVHLLIARWIAAHPLHPMSGVFFTETTREAIHDFNQPALYFYFLAGWRSLFGETEAAMHLGLSLFSLTAIVAFYRIARKLVPANALWLSGMLALGPAFAVEQNLMVDIPLLAVWLLFFDVLIVEEGELVRYVAAAMVCGAAILVKYSGLTLLPILAIVILVERRWRMLWVVCIPVAVVCGWTLFNYLDYGGFHIAQRPAHIFRGNPGYPILRFIGLIMSAGAVTPFGLIAAVRVVPGFRRHAPAIFAAAASAACLFILAVMSGVLDDTAADVASRVAFLVNGGLLLAVAFFIAARTAFQHGPLLPFSGQRIAPGLIMLLWIGGHLAFSSLYAPFMAVRHILPMIPALLLAGALAWRDRLPRADAAFGLVVTLGMSAMLGLADWRFAAFYRDEAASLRGTLPAGARVWFSGGLSWMWYASESGFEPFDINRPGPARGDFLVVLLDRTAPDRPGFNVVREDVQQTGLAGLVCVSSTPRFYGVPIALFPLAPWRIGRTCEYGVTVYRATGPS